MKKSIIVFILTLFVSISYAQYTPMTAAGYQFKRILCDSTLHIPSFCGIPTLRNSSAKNGAIAIDTCNNKFYLWTNQFGWGEITAASVDTTSLSNRIDLRVKYSDTSQMLSAYLRKADTTLMLSKYLRKADTASLSNRINLKLNLSDTATMLSKYLRKSDTASLSNRINLKLNVSDTATMLSKYLRKSDTASLSNRINLKLNISDTAAMLNKYLRKIDTTNKWVNNVTKKNDSTITIFKGNTATDITLPKGTGGGGGSQDLQSVVNIGNVLNGSDPSNGFQTSADLKLNSYAIEMNDTSIFNGNHLILNANNTKYSNDNNTQIITLNSEGLISDDQSGTISNVNYGGLSTQAPSGLLGSAISYYQAGSSNQAYSYLDLSYPPLGKYRYNIISQPGSGLQFYSYFPRFTWPYNYLKYSTIIDENKISHNNYKDTTETIFKTTTLNFNNNNSVNNNLFIPRDSSGILALSVNNVKADSTGNITISTGSQNGRYGNDTATIMMAKVHNNSGVILTNGKVVAFSTSGTSSDAPSVRLANNKADSTSANTFGFVHGTIAINDTGWIILIGKIEKLNTSAFTNGDIIYLDSISGGYTKTKPVAPYHQVYLGTIVKANAGNGSIYVKVINGLEIEELHDVQITSKQNNQIIVYSDTQKLWKNRSIYSVVDTVNTIATKTNVNSKVSSVTGTSPISSTGGTTPAISISQATSSTSGYITSTDYTNFSLAPNLAAIQSLGSSFKGITLTCPDFKMQLQSAALNNGTLYTIPVYVPYSITLTGIKFFQGTQGNYTANNYNGLGLYTQSNGVLTLVASSTNDGNIWKGTANTWQTKAFSSTYSASAGTYYIGFLYSSSSQVTAPTVGGAAALNNSAVSTLDMTNSNRLCNTINTQTTLTTPLTLSTTTTNGNMYGLFIY